MPWGADPAEFPPPRDLAAPKPRPGMLLITGDIAETESHVPVGAASRAQCSRVAWSHSAAMLPGHTVQPCCLGAVQPCRT
jgi:hypothetical protein